MTFYSIQIIWFFFGFLFIFGTNYSINYSIQIFVLSSNFYTLPHWILSVIIAFHQLPKLVMGARRGVMLTVRFLPSTLVIAY
jgi:hypothetical protein